MIPFDPLIGGTLLTLAFTPQDLCKIPKPAEINIIPRTAPVKYDYTKSHAELQNQQVDTINPYSYGAKTHTNGFMSGEISMKSTVKLDNTWARGNPKWQCVWYEDVTIEIAIDPTIVIAREVAADACMKNAVLEHELKHVRVDRKIVNKYAKTIGRKVYDGLKQRGFIAGPVREEDAQATANRMRETVKQLIELEYQKMGIERKERQQEVDNLEEYKNVNAKCPDFVSPAERAAQQQQQTR